MPNRDEPEDDDSPDGNYAHFRIESGDVVIYNRDNPRAWIQSDSPVDVGGA